MSNTFPNTPRGVPNTLGAASCGVSTPHLQPKEVLPTDPLAAFTVCLQLTRAAIEADAAVETLGSDPGLTRFADAAADAWACADAAFEAFRFGGGAPCDLADAAWAFLLMFEDDGDGLAMLSQRAGGIRRDAQICARSPLPDELAMAPLLHDAADLLDEMIWAALADHTARTGQEEPWTDWGL